MYSFAGGSILPPSEQSNRPTSFNRQEIAAPLRDSLPHWDAPRPHSRTHHLHCNADAPRDLRNRIEAAMHDAAEAIAVMLVCVKRKLFSIAATTSLLICLSALGLILRGHWHFEMWGVKTAN